MVKKKKLFKKFNCDVFTNAVWLLAGYTPEEYKKFLDKKGLPLENDIKYDRGGTSRFNGGLITVWIKKFDDYYTLTHEVVHASTFIMENKGIPTGKDNDEVLAYLVEYWTRKFWKAISKK
jgi:hypothetical protein